jgi:hypothetical protein
MEGFMRVRLFTSVASLDGSWPTGIRDIPDQLARELLDGGLAAKVPGRKSGKGEDAGDAGEEKDDDQTG